MTLHLTAAEQACDGLADAVGDAAKLAGPLPDLDTPAFSTVVATDGRILRLVAESDRGLTLHIAGRGNPVRLDRFQFAALALAIEHHLEAGFDR